MVPAVLHCEIPFLYGWFVDVLLFFKHKLVECKRQACLAELSVHTAKRITFVALRFLPLLLKVSHKKYITCTILLRSVEPTLVGYLTLPSRFSSIAVSAEPGQPGPAGLKP